jgi:glycosyltransferase involved in cell wall biosynthesis
MIISVVTGSFNRLESLIRMVRSVREHVPASIEAEIVVVDGGSQDGTIEWSKAQRDIRFIQHGELRGAIRAFCDGANAAQGRYVILANDDIQFLPGSILAALTHLETHPQCGAVAFMDDRPVQGRPAGAFRAQLMPATKDGSATSVVYAQVGMFRRELGNALGWWGADDPVMSKARTYGGDNWLSARIWEAGYTVDVVKGVSVKDSVEQDGLRTINANAHDRAYAQAYPHGPDINSKPLAMNENPEQLRIMYLPIFEKGHPQHRQTKRGLREALQRRGIVWEWDYLDDAHAVVAEDIQAFNPHLILTQFHDARWGKLIDQLRLLCPAALVVNWDGDARGLTDLHYTDMLRKVDLQLVVNALPLAHYQALGIPAAYWQIGYETRGPIPTDVPTHDVLFLGNCYSEHRKQIERVLRETHTRVGFYGFGWQRGDGNCLYDFGMGEALYKKATIAVADAFDGEKTYGFTSNRLIEALASGAFLLQEHIDGLDELNGTQAGVHYVEWRTLDELPALIAEWLKPAHRKERKKIAKAGQEFALSHFSFDRQVERLFGELIPRLEGQREQV